MKLWQILSRLWKTQFRVFRTNKEDKVEGQEIKSVIFTSDYVANKNKPRGRSSDFFILAKIRDDAGMIGKVGSDHTAAFNLSRLEEAVKRAKNNKEDIEGVTFATPGAKKWYKPWKWGS